MFVPGIAQMLWGYAATLPRDFLENGRSEALTGSAMPYPDIQALFTR